MIFRYKNPLLKEDWEVNLIVFWTFLEKYGYKNPLLKEDWEAVSIEHFSILLLSKCYKNPLLKEDWEETSILVVRVVEVIYLVTRILY